MAFSFGLYAPKMFSILLFGTIFVQLTFGAALDVQGNDTNNCMPELTKFFECNRKLRSRTNFQYGFDCQHLQEAFQCNDGLADAGCTFTQTAERYYASKSMLFLLDL